MVSTLGPASAASVGMIRGVHVCSSHRRPDTLVPTAPRAPKRQILMIDITDLPNGRHATIRHEPDFAGRKFNLGKTVLAGHQLRSAAGRTNHLPAKTGDQLDVMDERADGDIGERQRVPDPNLRLRT